jgi:hypothetical protein
LAYSLTPSISNWLSLSVDMTAVGCAVRSLNLTWVETLLVLPLARAEMTDAGGFKTGVSIIKVVQGYENQRRVDDLMGLRR